MKLNFLFLKKPMFLFVMLLMSQNILAQIPQVWFSETEIDFVFETEKRLVHTFEFSTRGMLTERLDGEKISGYNHQFLELTYEPNYVLSDQSVVSLGIRHRWEHMFDKTEHNEIRLIPQYEYEHAIPGFEFEHSVRLEHRFRGPEYVFRPRYQFGVARALSEIFAVELSSESLLSISPQSFPEYEQRFALEFGNSSFKNIGLMIGFEFRLEDYVHSIEHEYFILTGASIIL